MKFTSVVSYHMNPERCGVARFNQELANRLGVPFVGLDGEWGEHPLLSLKWSEMPQWSILPRPRSFAVLWHDAGAAGISALARQVFYLDPAHGSPSVICPPAPLPVVNPKPAVRLFAFGMAHKMPVEPYRKVKALIDATGWTFDLRVSMALHEGTDLQQAVLRCDEVSAAVGPENLKILGCLSDYALAEELKAAHAVCAFFPKGVRANNTSVHTAMQAGCCVVTNLDAESPEVFQHGVTVLDLAQLDTWPTVRQCMAVGHAGEAMSRDAFAWSVLLAQLRGDA